MMRRRFVATAAGAFATLGIRRRAANAAEFDFKLATDNPPDHQMTVRLVEASGKIKADSNGRLDIHVFPNNVLGNSTQQIVQVREGAIEFCTSADFVLADVVPVAGITATPFVFASAKDGLNAMAGPLGQYVRSNVSKVNVHPFERSWNSGLRQMINALHPINSPDDLKGLKMRTPPSPVMTALFKAFGASPTAINGNEMYAALQTHLVDGIELSMTAIESYKIYEVQKYVSYTNHVWTGYTILANADAWSRLPKNLRDITESRIDEAAVLVDGDVARLEASLEAKLKSQGMLFNHADTASFQAAVRRSGLYAQWRDTYGPQAWALLEKSVGKLS